mmetsp:Transcript_2031/g.5643  ORF Transcript_2031/g.5643 Transcript_2031/m.5643 type:complete len:279 (-) Transcript_2031:759-1595(-)
MDVLLCVATLLCGNVVLLGVFLVWGRDWVVSENGGTVSGLVAKVSSILGLKPARALMALRWGLVQKGEEPNSTLVVAFAGGGIRMGGVPRREFVRTLDSIRDVDVLFLTDPEQRFYGGDMDEWARDLRQVMGQYAVSVFVGNCMGSVGALALASRCRPDRVLVFGPIASPARDPRLEVRLYSRLVLSASQLATLEAESTACVLHTRQGVEVHRNASAKDLHHTAILSAASAKLGVKEKLTIVEYNVEGLEESAAKLLKRQGLLKATIVDNIRKAQDVL